EPETDAWRAASKQLEQVWRQMFSPNSHGSSHLRRPFRNSASIRFWVYRIALPLLGVACRQIGESAVWCDDETAIRASDYNLYCQKLESELLGLIKATHPVPLSFWRDRVLSLISLTDYSFATQQPLNRFPASSLVESSMM